MQGKTYVNHLGRSCRNLRYWKEPMLVFLLEDYFDDISLFTHVGCLWSDQQQQQPDFFYISYSSFYLALSLFPYFY